MTNVRLYRHRTGRGATVDQHTIAYGTLDGCKLSDFVRSFITHGVSAECEENGVRWRWSMKLERTGLS